jgi:hypothetical protein
MQSGKDNEIRKGLRMTSGSDLLDKVQMLSISTEELWRQYKIRAIIYFTPNEKNACCSKLNMPLSMESTRWSSETSPHEGFLHKFWTHTKTGQTSMRFDGNLQNIIAELRY